MFHTECNADQHLVSLLVRNDVKPKHHNDKGRVINTLRIVNGHIGIVDEDPFQVQPSYLKQMQLVAEKHELRLLKDNRENYVVIICPRLEEWIEKAISKSRKKLSDYFNVKNSKELHGIIHQRLPQLEMLTQEMLATKNPYFITLQAWLKHDF